MNGDEQIIKIIALAMNDAEGGDGDWNWYVGNARTVLDAIRLAGFAITPNTALVDSNQTRKATTR